MDVALAYDPTLDDYDLGPEHPLKAERVSRAMSLVAAYGLVRDGGLRPVPLRPASAEDILRVHDAVYVEAVRAASADPEGWWGGFGIGPGDTPAARGMHETSAAIAGATCVALESVLGGGFSRAFAPAGGLHHAHRDRAAGFCVYNDIAIAIASTLARAPDLRICYLDIDAHHGDGVQEAFYQDPRVLTVSLHEDGRYLYPGTGSYRERGAGAGAGTALNIPMPPYADEQCYLLAFDRVVERAVREFGPDLIVSQNGADAHWQDPLTTMGLTVSAYESLFSRIGALADRACDGRLVACGGGGYAWRTVVPRVWALLAASLVGVTLSDTLPDEWTGPVRAAGEEVPRTLRHDAGLGLDEETRSRVLHDTQFMLDRVAGA